jgi:hypothetical protein
MKLEVEVVSTHKQSKREKVIYFNAWPRPGERGYICNKYATGE